MENYSVLFGVRTCFAAVWQNHCDFSNPYLMKAGKFLKKCSLLAVFLLAAITLVWIFTHGLPYFCPVRWVIGIECPACGMTRAVNALLHLHFWEAWHYHPLIFVVVFYAVLLIVLWLFGKNKLMHAKWIWMIFIILFLTWWVLKAAAFLSGKYSSFYEPQALFPRMVRFFGQFL